MKHIIFVRHGKAEEKGVGIDDRSRKLLPSGAKKIEANIDTITQDEGVKKIFASIDKIISSGARRSKMTAEVIAQKLHIDRNKVIYSSSLRVMPEKNILEMIHSLPEKYKNIIIVGHNDSLSNVSIMLSNHPIDYMNKSGIVILGFSTEKRDQVNKRHNTYIKTLN